MKFLKIAAAVLVVLFVIAAIAAPIGPMPGFTIGGTAAQAPATWGDTSAIDEIHLQVNDGPFGRTVIIWMVQIEEDLYVLGEASSGWAQAIGSGGPVRMQMEGKLYNLTATPVTEGQAQVIETWRAKYADSYPDIIAGFPPMEEALHTTSLFRLSRRA